jgi:DNA-binding PadR family transcriptional regulator
VSKREEVKNKIIQICMIKPSTGLDIQDGINKGKRWFWQKMGLHNIYPLLRAMEREGYLRSYLGEPMDERNGLRRRYYVATGKKLPSEQENLEILGLMAVRS